MRKRAARALEAETARRDIPIGPWLTYAQQRFPDLDIVTLMVAALHRVNYQALLKNVTVFIGESSEVGAVSAAIGSVPGQLTVRTTDRGVEVSFGAIGMTGDKVAPRVIWKVSVDPIGDCTTAKVQTTVFEVIDDALPEKKLYRALLDAIADALATGVALERHTVTDDWKHLVEAGLPANQRDAFTVSRGRFGPIDIPLSPTSAQAVAERLRIVTPPSVARRLQTTGSWPLTDAIDSGLRLRGAGHEAAQLIVTVLRRCGKIVQESEVSMLRRAIEQIDSVPFEWTPATESYPQIRCGSPRLPVAALGWIPTHVLTARDVVTSLVPARQLSFHVRRGLKKAAVRAPVVWAGTESSDVAFSWALVGATSGYPKSFGSDQIHALGSMSFLVGDDERVGAALTGLTFSSGEFIEFSDMLTPWLDLWVDLCSMSRRPVDVLVSDRSRPWT